MLKKLTIITLLAMFSLSSVAQAISLPEGLALSSNTDGEMSIIKKDIEPGKEYSFDFTVINKHNRDAEYMLFPSDVVTKVGGDWVYNKDNTSNVNSATWYTGFDGIDFKVAKGETSKHTFKVKVPESIEPGEYITGIVLSETISVEELKSLGSDSESLAAGAKEIGLEKPIHIVLNYNLDKAVSNVVSIGAIAYSDDAKSNRPFSDRTGLFRIDLEFDNKGTKRGKTEGSYKLFNESSKLLIEKSNYAMLDVYPNTIGIYRLTPNNGYLEPGSYLLQWNDANGEYEYRFKVDSNSSNKALEVLDNNDKVSITKNNNTTIIFILGIIVLVLMFIVIILLRRKKKKEQKEESS